MSDETILITAISGHETEIGQIRTNSVEFEIDGKKFTITPTNDKFYITKKSNNDCAINITPCCIN